MAERKYLPIGEFREFGYLQEVNRRFLHPLGLALEVTIDDEGNEFLSGVWDDRDDPEGIIFYDSIDLSERADRVANEMWERWMPRRRRLGYVIQPAGHIITGPTLVP